MNECALVCDAPPYPVVRAARQVGLHSPEDVAWRRTSVSSLLTSPTLRSSCRCGTLLRRGKRVRFDFAGGSSRVLVLAQCRRCRTVHWAVEA